MTRAAGRLGHLPALDGIRGLAVAGVVAFHAGYLQGGFLGVDLFFVLSGFLITSLLLGEHADRGTIGLGPFWIRRARRLLPALLAVLVAVAAYARWFAAPVELDAIRRDGLATIAYGANWEQIRSGVSYWDAFKAPSPLEHTWSLAIEEQFYVVWPVLVLVVLALAQGSRRALAAVAGVLAAASMVALVVLHHPGADTSRAYFGSDSRASSLLFGALAAMALARRPAREGPPSRAWALVSGAAVVGVGIAWVTATGTSDWVYRGGLPLTAVAAAVAIYAVAIGGAGRTLTAALSWPPLRHLGLVSYGLYLWHWPVDVVVTPERAHLSGVGLAVLQAAIALAIAEVSYHLLEMPIRRGALSGVVARTLTPATIGLAALVVVVATTGAVNPAASTPASAAAASAPPAVAGAVRVLLVGDSGAAHLGPGLAAAAAEQSATRAVQVAQLGQDGCGVLREGDGSVDDSGRVLADPDGCHDWPARWAGTEATFQPQIAVLNLVWSGMGDRDIGGAMRHPCDPVFDADYTAAVTLAIDTLSASGAQVMVTTTPYTRILGSDYRRVDCLNASYRSAVAARPAVAHVIDLFSWVCPAGECRATDGGVDLRPDGVHFEGPSATIAGRFVLTESLRLSTASGSGG